LRKTQIHRDIEQATADGAYDGAPTYQTIVEHGAHIGTVIPPSATAVLNDEAGHAPSQRDGHIDMIEAKGRLEWRKATGYGRRSLVETTMGRYKRILARNVEQGCLPVNRPRPPSASRFSITCLRPAVRIPSVPP